MNCTKNKNKYLAALSIMIIALAAFTIIADASSAETSINSDISAEGFMHDKTGTLHVRVYCNNQTEDERADTIKITVVENGNTLKDESFDVKSGWNTLNLSFQLSQGSHDLEITVVDESGNTSSQAFNLNVDKSVWSNMTTYLAIAALAIIILIIAVVYMRSNPRNKPTTTFTELEKEKTATPSSGSGSAAKPTEKVKYESSRRK